MVSETTPLTAKSNPNLAFLIRRRTRQFQCCICGMLIALIITLVVVTLSFLEVNNGNDISDAIENGSQALKERDIVEENMKVLQTSSPSFRHQMSTATSSRADKIGRIGYATYHASIWLANKRKHDNDPSLLPCSKDELKNTGLCIENILHCSQSRYRSIDGTCNNLKHPSEWGVAFTKFRRMMPPEYEDGIGEPRGGYDSQDLPSASTISALVHRPTYKDDPNFTIILAVWGQFMDHDITATALSRGKNGEAISCCYSNFPHPECFPVHEKQTDGGIHCTDFVRSAPAATCCLGPREQFNQVSSYLDGSAIYGSEPELSHKLRTFQNGKLDMLTTASGRHLLPVSHNASDGCNREEMSKKNRYCFLSGDARANENLHLTTMHLLWARQHNRIAAILSELNPHWDDSMLYDESRHIVAAQVQHITFKEFLPVILGYELVQKYDLYPYEDGYYYGYNESLDITIANEFAAAAFRFAHTLIPGLIRMIGNNNSNEAYVRLHEMLFDPFRLYDDELDDVLEGAMQTPIEASDPYFSDELKHHLFERNAEKKLNKTCGLDLVALNIQRGRDHGLPNYVKWRKFCGLSVPNKFEDMKAYIDEDSLDVISHLYSSINDIDPYTGALSERPVKGGLVGPTARCIILDQFIRIKNGDRYWYETPEMPQAFTPNQLNEIRKTTLASLICDNGDNIESVPQWVMRRSNINNNIVSCTEVPSLNLTYWEQI